MILLPRVNAELDLKLAKHRLYTSVQFSRKKISICTWRSTDTEVILNSHKETGFQCSELRRSLFPAKHLLCQPEFLLTNL